MWVRCNLFFDSAAVEDVHHWLDPSVRTSREIAGPEQLTHRRGDETGPDTLTATHMISNMLDVGTRRKYCRELVVPIDDLVEIRTGLISESRRRGASRRDEVQG